MSDFLNIELEPILNYLKSFLKNPIKEIRTLPEWEWRTLMAISFIFGAASGSLHGLFSGSFLGFIYGLIFFPILLSISYLIISGFFYYFFLFFLKTEVSFIKIITLMILSNIPFLASYIISPLASPLSLIGIAASGILLIVGFVDALHLPKNIIVRLVGALLAFHFIMWIWSHIQISQQSSIRQNKSIERQNLDILEKEIKEF